MRRYFSFIFLILNIFTLHIPARAEFRFRLNEDLGTLDWGYGEVNAAVVQQLMVGLTSSGLRGEPIPAIAVRWVRSGGKRPKYVFELRDDARWSDGVPVCASHFVDAWRRVLSPDFASPYAHYLFDLKNAKRFHSGKIKDVTKIGAFAEGCHKLVVELERPVSYFPALASHWVLSPIRLDVIQKYGRKWIEPANLVVTGPYVIEEWIRDKYFKLKKNPIYFGRPAFEEKLKAVVIPEDATALLLFQNGSLDWIRDIPFLEKPKLSALKEYRLFPSFVGYHLGFRFGTPGALDRPARCALAHALEKWKIPILLKGGETPAWSLIPPGLSSHPASAAEFVPKKMGQPAGPLDLYFYSKDIHLPLMEWVQEEWRKKFGISPRLTRLDSKSYWARLHRDPPMIFLSGTTAAYAHPYSFLSEFITGSHANWGRFSSTQYDEAVFKAASLEDGPVRARWIARAEKILLDEECAIIPLYFRQTASLVSDRWDGFQMNPMTYVYLKDVRVKKK